MLGAKRVLAGVAASAAGLGVAIASAISRLDLFALFLLALAVAAHVIERLYPHSNFDQ